jgi:glycosyltransferase involved in cell wall biosynthesis
VHLLAPRDYKTDEVVALGCTFHELRIESKSTNPLKDLTTFYGLYKTYRKLNPDLVIHYTIKPNIYGSIAAGLLNIPSIAITTGLGYSFLKEGAINKLVTFLYRFAFRYSKSVWFLNQDDLNVFVQKKILSKEKVFLLPGEGVNINEFKPSEVSPKISPKVFLLIARMIWDKGVREFVEAAQIVKRQYPEIRFQLLGPTDSDNPNAVPKKIVEQWHQDGIIEYMGVSNDVTSEIRNATAVVLPTYYKEGMPKVLMEAAAMGKPIVATNVSGCKEVINEGENGFLCEPRNASDLAEKIIHIINLSDEQLLNIGKKSRELMVMNYDERMIIQHYYMFIHKLLKF